MDTTTGMLIAKIINPARTRKEIAPFYADAILMEHYKEADPDWMDINEHIRNRWSQSGLEYIKRLAWKIVDSKYS
jgi:hypothetical protein